MKSSRSTTSSTPLKPRSPSATAVLPGAKATSDLVCMTIRSQTSTKKEKLMHRTAQYAPSPSSRGRNYCCVGGVVELSIIKNAQRSRTRRFSCKLKQKLSLKKTMCAANATTRRLAAKNLVVNLQKSLLKIRTTTKDP